MFYVIYKYAKFYSNLYCSSLIESDNSNPNTKNFIEMLEINKSSDNYGKTFYIQKDGLKKKIQDAREVKFSFQSIDDYSFNIDMQYNSKWASFSNQYQFAVPEV